MRPLADRAVFAPKIERGEVFTAFDYEKTLQAPYLMYFE